MRCGRKLPPAAAEDLFRDIAISAGVKGERMIDFHENYTGFTF